jgi:integrase
VCSPLPQQAAGPGNAARSTRCRAVKLIRASKRLPHARLHDLRHLHATTLLLSGVPVHVVAARLGHADPAITLRVYAHVIRSAEAAAADIFADAVKAGC